MPHPCDKNKGVARGGCPRSRFTSFHPLQGAPCTKGREFSRPLCAVTSSVKSEGPGKPACCLLLLRVRIIATSFIGFAICVVLLVKTAIYGFVDRVHPARMGWVVLTIRSVLLPNTVVILAHICLQSIGITSAGHISPMKETCQH